MSKPNRFYSKKQENKVAAEVAGKRTANSGATVFDKGDVKTEDLLIECKTLTKPQKTRTIEKKWMDGIFEEAVARGKKFGVVAVDFGDGENYYILNRLDFAEMLSAWRELNEKE